MSTDIKHVIGLLCKQLNLMFNTNLKPEYFRLAKFDKKDENVIPILWSTLSLLTINESQADLDKVKAHMKSLNYVAELFYSLSEDSTSGSREILLAIAFIIAKDFPNMIEEEMKRSPFHDDSCSLLDLENVNVLKPETPVMKTDNDMKNYLMWLKGKTQQNKKLNEEYELQIKKIYEKLNGTLNNKAAGDLSMNEVLALSSKKYCKEFLERCSHILSLLDCHQEWTRKEKIFWKWMATVLFEREKE